MYIYRAHIPPTSKKGKAYYTDDCLDGYLELLGTYKNTVVGHFAGHYNSKCFYLFFDVYIS